MSNYVVADYIAADYFTVEEYISINWETFVITVPKAAMALEIGRAHV